MSVIRVGLTPAVSVPEALTFLYMIRSHDVHASREFRYMVDWFSQSLGDRNALHARSCQEQSDALGSCIHGDLMWNLDSANILTYVRVHGFRTIYHTRPRSCTQESLWCPGLPSALLPHRCSLCRLHSLAIRGTRPRRVPHGARDRPPHGAEHLFGSQTDSRDCLLRERLQRLGQQGTRKRTGGWMRKALTEKFWTE